MWNIQVPSPPFLCGRLPPALSRRSSSAVGVSRVGSFQGSHAALSTLAAPHLKISQVQIECSQVWTPPFHFQGVHPSSVFAASPSRLANFPGTGSFPSTTPAVTGVLRMGNGFSEYPPTALLLVLTVSSQSNVPSCFPCCHRCKEAHTTLVLLCRVFLLVVGCSSASWIPRASLVKRDCLFINAL